MVAYQQAGKCSGQDHGDREDRGDVHRGDERVGVRLAGGQLGSQSALWQSTDRRRADDGADLTDRVVDA
ncbi:hypothetical protein [Kitasatospora sp. NPDC092286]|uniref:hypothetical protein n=1 Tax=Kitasatospora sp. NPDC092286 TaxID=3364087 RepID=UPI003825B0F3